MYEETTSPNGSLDYSSLATCFSSSDCRQYSYIAKCNIAKCSSFCNPFWLQLTCGISFGYDEFYCLCSLLLPWLLARYAPLFLVSLCTLSLYGHGLRFRNGPYQSISFTNCCWWLSMHAFCLLSKNTRYLISVFIYFYRGTTLDIAG